VTPFTLEGPRQPRFFCSLDSIDQADIVLAGFPYDSTASFRAGARFGPSAHADVCDEHMGESYTHGSVMRRCLDDDCPKLIQYGVRCLYQEEYEYLKKEKRVVSADSVDEIAAELREGEPVYVSIDVAFFDPSLVPGTGTLEAGGKSFQDFIEVLKMLRSKKVNIIGANVVELAPDLDPTGDSTIFVSRVLREFLLCF